MQGVLFEDDADSTLDDVGISDQSSVSSLIFGLCKTDIYTYIIFLLHITSKLQELTDSEENNTEDSFNTDDEGSGEESGLGHTPSSGDEGPGLVALKPQDKTARSKKTVKTYIEQDSTNSIEMLTNKMKQTDVAIQPVGQKGWYSTYDNFSNIFKVHLSF